MYMCHEMMQMATNEVVELNDIWLMDRDELQKHLMEAGLSEESSSILLKVLKQLAVISIREVTKEGQSGASPLALDVGTDIPDVSTVPMNSLIRCIWV